MLNVGRVVSTSYGSGPYKIICISDVCYQDNCNPPGTGNSEPHYHITCKAEGDRGSSYLNGYRADGTNVWNDDYLIFNPVAIGENYDLFN